MAGWEGFPGEAVVETPRVRVRVVLDGNRSPVVASDRLACQQTGLEGHDHVIDGRGRMVCVRRAEAPPVEDAPRDDLPDPALLDYERQLAAEEMNRRHRLGLLPASKSRHAHGRVPIEEIDRAVGEALEAAISDAHRRAYS